MDLGIVETGNGGDFSMIGVNPEMVDSFENHPYLGMYGGNKEASTSNIKVAVESFDFWGNNLLWRDNQSIQMNSEFERALDKINLTSAGRIRLIDLAKKDLEFMSAYAKVEVDASITATDWLEMKIKITASDSSTSVRIINFRKSVDGDFSILDFNNDFNI